MCFLYTVILLIIVDYLQMSSHEIIWTDICIFTIETSIFHRLISEHNDKNRFFKFTITIHEIIIIDEQLNKISIYISQKRRSIFRIKVSGDMVEFTLFIDLFAGTKSKHN